MIDLERLLAPISGDSPCGRNLRLVPGDVTFVSLDGLRREEDPAFDVAGKGKNSDWKGVVAKCDEALTTKSKDLQLAAYLAEALARTQGYAGLRDGLRVVNGLVERYWDGLHPGVEGGEIVPGVRAKWLSWMGSSNDFRAAVKRIPIAGARGAPGRSWLDFEESRRVDDAAMLTDKTGYNELVQSGRITGEEWKTALNATPLEQLQQVAADVKTCDEELRRLVVACEEKLGADSPSLIALGDLLEECRTLLDKTIVAQTPLPEEAVAPGAAGSGTARGGSTSGPISTRDDAYRRLREVADYLRRSEPHSPVSYLIDRAVRWGQLPFQDLLRDVLKHNEDARTTVLETLGLAEPEE
jgi:type VI secretion system protein ImpA